MIKGKKSFKSSQENIGQCKTKSAECRLQNRGKMRTESKKCRLQTWPGLFETWITLSAQINPYLADSVVCFVNTYPLDNDLSGG